MLKTTKNYLKRCSKNVMLPHFKKCKTVLFITKKNFDEFTEKIINNKVIVLRDLPCIFHETLIR